MLRCEKREKPGGVFVTPPGCRLVAGDCAGFGFHRWLVEEFFLSLVFIS